MKRFLLVLAFLAGIAPACAQQSISSLPQVATPADADLFPLDVQSYPVGQRTHSVSAAGLTSYILGKIPLGPQGVPGQTGPATTLFPGTTTTGAPGSSAAVSVTGTAPVQYLNITVPQGAQGSTGPAGSAGPKGDAGVIGAAGPAGATGAPGPSNNLSIGTVTTGAAGSLAGASVAGASPAQTLNLTIPTGPTGPIGPQGPPGASGSGTGNVSSSGSYTVGDFLLAGNNSGTSTTDGGAPGAAAFKSLSFFLQSASNLSDLPSVSSARSNLGLGTAATQAAASFLQAANNLADLPAPGTARTNLGLGGAALLNVGTATGTVAAGNDGRIAGALQTANNLSDLAAPATARTSLGLGTIATQGAGAVAITGGTINGTAIGGTTPAAGAFSTLSVTTPVPVTSGGTGSSTASGALSNLGGVTSAQAAAAAPVQSVAGRTGAVTLAVGDVSGAAKSGANTDITSLANPALGAATATTQAANDNSTKVATDQFVATAVAAAPSGGGSPSAYNTHALPYTAALADKGTTINPTGTGALSLPTATATSGWYAYVRKRDEGGAATLTPASGTIDGLASIVAYKEEFLVYYDAAASIAAGVPVYRTQGRQRGWIDFGSFSVTTGAANVLIQNVFSDIEIRDFELNFSNYVGSSSSTINYAIYQNGSGTAVSVVGESYSAIATTLASGTTSSTALSISAAATTSPQKGKISLENIQSTVANGASFKNEAFYNGGMRVTGGMLSAAGPISGTQLLPSTGTITSMLYNVRLYRP